MDEETQHSLECIQANQIFPRKQLIREDENLQVPFIELHGESTEYVGRAEDAIIALSNYRLHIKFKESVVNVPLQLIESVECRDIFQLHLTCKDCKVIRCQFSTFEQCQDWLKRLNNAIRPPSKIEDLFSFAYHAWCMEVYASEKEQHGDLCRPGEHVTSRFKNEVERMGFDMNNAWRISNINEKYKLCGSYPQEIIVPAWITDKELESVASFRSWKRIPAVVYRHQSNGAVISRCGQPEVSWWGWRNADDEHLVQSVAKACASDSRSNSNKLINGNCSRDFSNGGDLSDVEFDSSISNASGAESLAIQPQKLLILDARSYAAAVANRAKGGGCECPEYYPNCEVVFMGMANIHSIRKSFQSLRLLCTQMPDPGNWLSALESTKWLQHLSVLLKSALLVVHAVDRDQRPVLVHCSDGWDRTPQIVALAKLLLDPYYRTTEGFQVLVETEWLDFGHKFADRCGHGENSDDLNERCPVFLQWLDCVHQLQRQFPCSFEFNEAFLVKLVQHTYSCLFGTFLCNNAKERGEKHTQERTCSVWSLLRAANKAFKNLLYSSQSESVLYPVCHVRNLMLWSAVYLPCSSPSTPADDTCAPYPAPGSSPEDQPLGRLPKTRSFDNLTTACDSSVPTTNRRSSDPSLNEKWQEHRRSLELSSLAECKDEIVCNGELEPENKMTEKPAGFSIAQKYHVTNGHCVNGEDGRIKASLSRQVSTASCSSAQFHLRNLHQKWMFSHLGKQQAASSPDQPARSHLDDDGMPVYTDVVQQRLRQIESGHQQEVETLKKQVQELKSRLESQFLNSSFRLNGDYGDEVTSIPDSESNLDQNCLSRCSTEIFSEASWEQVDKQDTEVTRWLPDHLAAHCYGCDSTFWLASRKHHCRNCGNVFCSSCCNQKVPVPSQQLFEPSRVCKSCYSSLHPSSSSLDLELDKPITATSN
ncbi:phosphatidylinositol-3,5-bisphosphate 3-phosphatase MTMR3 isoform 3-T3 [Sarcoramphus papa]